MLLRHLDRGLRHKALLFGALAALVASGCMPHDDRKPEQPPAPATPNVPAPTDLGNVGGPPAATAPSEADAGTPPAEQEADAVAAPPLEDGEAAARAMLETPDWGNAAKLAIYCKDSIARAARVREGIYGLAPGSAEIVDAFNQLELALDTPSGLSGLLFNVSPVEAVRDAAKKCEQDLNEFTTDVSLDRKLYDALVSVKVDGMAPIPARFVSHSLRDFRRAGVDKDDATRKRIAEIQARLVVLSQDYDKNVNGDVRSIVIDDPKRLEGLPQDWLDNHKPVDGKIKVTTDYPDFFPFETYVKDDALRHELYQEFSQRAYPANASVLLEVLELRKELATLLGYPSWAAYAIEDKMAKSTDTVESFIEEVKEVTEPRTSADLEVLLARKRQDIPDAKAIMAHDRFYYVAVVHKEQFDFDPQSVRPFFAYEKVKQGVLDLYAELFGLEFVKLDLPTWAPGVDAYELKVDGKTAGRFFLDMHPRKDKYKHAAAFPIQTGLASGRLGWASLVCNFPDPADGDGQALMEHGDVVTFFHEFGHLVHALIGRTGDFPSLAGFNVEWDFVEAPSQFLEEWAWRPEVLQRFAKDKDGNVIPAALVQRMRAAEEFGKGVQLMRQIFYTAYSFFIHKVDPANLDLDAFTTEMYEKYSPFPRDEKDKVYANFGHLIGYSALYYTYQWSLAISKDLFTRFDKEGILNKEVALEYRHDILEPGGTQDADVMIQKFLGRPRNLDAYKAWIEKVPTPR